MPANYKRITDVDPDPACYWLEDPDPTVFEPWPPAKVTKTKSEPDVAGADVEA